MKAKVCSFFALLLWSCVAGAQRDQTLLGNGSSLSPEAVMSGWETALGGRGALQQAKIVHLHGTVTTGGMRGSFDRWASASGELRTTIDLEGGLRQTIVFDGRRAWIQDKTGTVHEITGEMLRAVISSAYEASNSAFFAQRMPGKVLLTGSDSAGLLTLQVVPVSGSTFTVYLDGSTFLPIREEATSAVGRRTISFSDWHEYGALNFPGTIRQSNGDRKFDSVITLDGVQINSASPPGTFSEPAASAETLHFSAAHRAGVPAAIYGDHILVSVRVNGSEAGWFFLDSGAAMSVVSRSLATRAGLTLRGNVRGQGTGEGSASLGLTQNVTFDIGEVSVPPSTVAIWDFSELLPVLGRSWDGLIGFDVLSRVVARLDYEHGQVTFIDPSTFVPPTDATILPIKFLGNLPVVRGAILLPGREPIETDLAIDSGADGLHLTTPFVEKNQVVEAVPNRIAPPRPARVAGRPRGRGGSWAFSSVLIS